MVTKKKKLQRGGSRLFGQRSPKPKPHAPKVAPVNPNHGAQLTKEAKKKKVNHQSAVANQKLQLQQATGVKAKVELWGVALKQNGVGIPGLVKDKLAKTQGPPVKPKQKNKPVQLPAPAVAPAVLVPEAPKHNINNQVQVLATPSVAISDVVKANRIAAAFANPSYENPNSKKSAGEYFTVSSSNSTETTLSDAGKRSNYMEVEASRRPKENSNYLTILGNKNTIYNVLPPPVPPKPEPPQNNTPPLRPSVADNPLPPLPPKPLPLTPQQNNAPPPLPPRQTLLPPKPQNNNNTLPLPPTPKPGTPPPEQPQNNTYNTVEPPKPDQPPPLPPRKPLTPPALLPRNPQPPPRPPKPNIDNLTNEQITDAADGGVDYIRNLIPFMPQNNQADLQLMLKDLLRQQKNLKISISQTQSQQPQTQTPQQSAEQKKKIRGFFDKLWHNIKFISGDLKTESKELHHTTIERGEKQRALGRQLRAYRNSRQNTKKAMRNQRMSEMRSNLNSSNRPKTLRQTSTTGTQRQEINIGNY